MDALGSTSFDRYARYLYTYRLRTELLPARSLRILDVGDPYGTLAPVFPDDLTVSIDLLHEAAPLDDGHQHLLGSGFALPFPGGAFDLVTAHDVLEHVPADGRAHFVRELLRVSSGPVMVAAPFADLRTSTCERIVNSYYVAHVGHSLEPLDEHAEAGLPDLEALTEVLDEAAVPHVVYSDGWLFHWIAFMLLKAHYVSLGAADLDRATDAAFNRLLRDADARGPHYRRALILRPPSKTQEVFGPPAVPAPAEDVEADRDLLERMAWELIGALPRGEDPSAPTSAFRRWLQAPAPDAPKVRDLARSLGMVLDSAAETVAGADRRAEATVERVTVTAVVLAREGGVGRRAAELLAQMAGIDDVLLCAAGGDVAVTSPKVRVLEVDGDDVLQLAHAVVDVKSDAMLVVDPGIAVEPDLVAPLLAALDDPDVCIGYHRPADRAPVQAAGIRVDGTSALYVARELFVIGRDLYRAVGGLDGRFRSRLDDLDLGWRLNLYGHRVTTVGPATWGAPQSVLDADVATLWAWIKNLDVTSLDKVLPGAVLLLAAEGPTGDTDLFDGFETLLRGRAEVAQRRVVGDSALQARFGTLALAPAEKEPARTRQRLVRDAFPWPTTAAAATRQSVLLMADDATQERMISLAQLVGENADVTLATPCPTAPTVHALSAVDELDVQKFLEHADVVVVPSRLVPKYRTSLEHWDGVVVVDLDAADDGPADDLALERGDVFLCSSPAQRDHWAPQLLRRGRGQRADDNIDQVLLLVVVTPPPDRRVVHEADRGARRLVIDLAALPPQLEQLDGLIAELGAATADLADLVVVGDPDGRHRALDAERGLQAEHAMVLLSPTAEERRCLLSEATMVIRPTPRPATPSGASARGAIDALALGVPVVTSADDPIGWLVAKTGAGAVTASDASAIAALVLEALRDPVVASGWRAAAVTTAKAVADGQHGSSFRSVVLRPWRWRAAHAGGLVPLEQTPAVARLLDEREVEVTRAVTAAVTAELRAEHEDLVARTRADLEVVRMRLGEVEDELDLVRHEAHRLRNHPVVRLASALRRRLFNG